MRRHVLLTVGVVAAAMILPGAAEAQFPFSPRGFLGAVTAPLRGMLERLPHGSVHRHRASRGTEANRAAPPEQDQQLDQAKLGWVGPLAWPTAYEDVVGYTLWPNDYGEDFRQHGFGDIVATIVGPLRAPAPTVVGTSRPETVGAAPGNACDGNSAAQSDWPGVQIAQTITLTPEQKSALDKLQAASAEAVKTIKAGCIDAAQRPPTQRLTELEQRLWQVQNAGSLIRAPLKAFYDRLTPEQKAKFTVQTPAPPPQEKRADPRAANGPMGKQYQACAAQSIGDADRLIKQIQQAVGPTPQQRAGLEAFGKASSDMAKLLIASCAQPMPADPVARLDAADSRLVAMNYAATNVDVALNAFYGGLTDEQKAKFDTLGK
jgi:Spy/CpxP family protein refolding chaperone